MKVFEKTALKITFGPNKRKIKIKLRKL